MEDAALLHAALAAVWPEVERRLDRDDFEVFESDVLLELRRADARADRAAVEVRDDGVWEPLDALFAPYPDLRRLLDAELDVLALLGERTDALSGTHDHVSAMRRLDIPVNFVTDRAWDAKRLTFGESRGTGELAYGRAVLSIGDDRRMGELPKPGQWRLRLGKGPATGAAGALAVRDETQFLGQVAQESDVDGSRSALVFVHGYNVDFGDALRRAAQLVYDLDFHGACVAYSWPSAGKRSAYVADEGHVHWSARHFRDFLKLLLTRSGVDQVHVVAHSMGNRLLVDTLTRLDTTALPVGSGRLGQVVFAAPDVDAGVFTQAAEEFAGRADRFTLYASSKDKALIASRKVHGYHRAGQSGQALVVVSGVDTVDASRLDTGLMSHSYFGDKDALLGDLHALVHHGHSPQERFRLRGETHAVGVYWSFAQ